MYYLDGGGGDVLGNVLVLQETIFDVFALAKLDTELDEFLHEGLQRVAEAAVALVRDRIVQRIQRRRVLIHIDQI